MKVNARARPPCHLLISHGGSGPLTRSILGEALSSFEQNRSMNEVKCESDKGVHLQFSGGLERCATPMKQALSRS
jgi:hypothetical protein